MGDISEHFDRSEFACRDRCGFDTVDVQLLTMLEAAHQHFRANVYINDGCRCPTHNAIVGGEPDSQHMRGKAVDLRIDGVTPDDVASYFEQTHPHSHGVGRYNTFTHVDCRDSKARWDKRK